MDPETKPARAEALSARGSLAINARWHGPDAPQTLAARRDLRAARIRVLIEQAISAEPPLTADQRYRLSTLIVGGHDVS